MERLEEVLKNPAAMYRIKPFWFWNGDITEEGLDYQIREMKDKGLGGFFICARQGLTVPYLSGRWFELVEFACRRAKELGMEAWLYDEYPYPSGMSGGEVLKLHPEAEHMVLHHERIHAEEGGRIRRELGWGEVLYAGAFLLREDGSRIYEKRLDLMEDIGSLQTSEIYQITGLTMYNNKRFFSYGPQEVLETCLPEGSWDIDIYIQKPLGDFKFYGGFFDPCSKEAVRSFLDTTHEKYRKALGKNMSESVMGIFSDEVGMLSPIPWSKKVIQAFRDRKGYSLTEVLPALHDENWEGAYRIRYDLYDVIHQIFVESYHKQVSDWCGEHGISYCSEVPYMRLSTQRYSHIPGGDTAHEKAGRELEWIYDKYLCAFRYSSNAASSLARQLGREQCLIESFHSVGWTMTLQDAKWMIDRLCSSGINFFVFHAFYYTIDSITKHDAPPSQFFQNPYWRHYRSLADYVGRIGAYTSNTRDTCSTAVLDPVPTMWALLGDPFQGFPYRGESEQERKRCDEIRDNWVYTTKTLLLNQLQYNHLDSEMLPDFEVKDGRISMGNASYSLIVVPPAYFYERKALQKLREFAESGGSVIFLGNLPYMSIDAGYTDEEAGEEWQELLLQNKERVTLIPAKGLLSEAQIEERYISRVREILDEPVEVRLDNDTMRRSFITSVRRDMDGKFCVSLINQGRNRAEGELVNRTGNNMSVTALSMETGDARYIGECRETYRFSVPGLASIYLRLEECEQRDVQQDEQAVLTLPSEQEFEISIEGKNVYRLAEFLVTADGRNWWETEAKTLIEQCASAPVLDGSRYSYESTFGTPKQIHISYPVDLTYKTTFYLDADIRDMELLWDRRAVTGVYRISVNGSPLREEDFYHRFINDQNNQLCDISRLIRSGENEIKIEVTAMSESDGVRDPLYLLGSFGVQDLRLTSMPHTARFEPEYTKGFPYYSGHLHFKTKAEIQKENLPEVFQLRFDFEDRCLDCLSVKINGHDLGIRAFTPYVWECRKEWIREDDNEIELVRTNTLANMLDGTYFDYDSHRLVNI